MRATGYSWSVRHRTTVGYLFSRDELEQQTRMTMHNQVATLGHSWTARRNAGLVFSSDYATSLTEQALGQDLPLDSQTANMGIKYRKAVSRTRNIVLSGGGGARRVETLSAEDRRPLDYVAPSYYGGARLDLGRTWALSADLRRATSFMTGITIAVVPDDHGIAVARWQSRAASWVVSMNGTYSQGQPHEGEVGSFRARMPRRRSSTPSRAAARRWAAIRSTRTTCTTCDSSRRAFPPGTSAMCWAVESRCGCPCSERFHRPQRPRSSRNSGSGQD